MSQLQIFPDSGGSTSCPEGSPAPTSPAREKAWDSSEEAGVPYGWKWPGLSESAARLGFSLRTFLLCALEELTPCSLTWKRLVTPRGRWWWVLGRSGLRTGEIESGLSGGDWATMTVVSAEHPGRRSKKAHQQDCLSMQVMAQEWATPQAHSAKKGYPERNLRAKADQARGGFANPEDQVLVDWPTPTAEPYGSNQGGSMGRSGPKRPSLESLAREWPTATARDWKSTKASPATHGKNSRPLSEAAGQDWPTPKEVDGRPKGNAGLNRKSPGLDALARGGQLAEENPNSNGSLPGSLNPDWVEALMGAPPGWTDLPEDLTRKLYAGRRSSKAGADETA